VPAVNVNTSTHFIFELRLTFTEDPVAICRRRGSTNVRFGYKAELTARQRVVAYPARDSVHDRRPLAR